MRYYTQIIQNILIDYALQHNLDFPKITHIRQIIIHGLWAETQTQLNSGTWKLK